MSQQICQIWKLKIIIKANKIFGKGTWYLRGNTSAAPYISYQHYIKLTELNTETNTKFSSEIR
jgi:hypothetical protein